MRGLSKKKKCQINCAVSKCWDRYECGIIDRRVAVALATYEVLILLKRTVVRGSFVYHSNISAVHSYVENCFINCGIAQWSTRT